MMHQVYVTIKCFPHKVSLFLCLGYKGPAMFWWCKLVSAKKCNASPMEKDTNWLA